MTIRGRRVLIAAGLVVALLLGVAGYAGWRYVHPGRGEFPAVRSDLTSRQRAVLTVARTEWQHPRPATDYSAGIREDWCADFVSWVMRRAGYSLSNPNSGSWRIPGVYTLQDALRRSHRFHAARTGYRPQAGDIVLYAAGSSVGQHTNLVIDTEGDTLRTVGGNQRERIGKASVTVRSIAVDDRAIVGYGAA